ncbi:hypothetical protein FKM82_003150 [Ascaphus truei]
MECLTPALNAVPVDEWFCPQCAAANLPTEDAEHVSEEEVTELLADVVPTTSRLRANAVRTRAIARTRQSERVRANVNRIRITTAHRIQNVPRYIPSTLLDDTIETVVAGLSTAVYQRPLTPRVVTNKRKRKVGRKKTTTQSKLPKGTRGVGKKRRRRFKRRKGRKQTARKVPTPHRRIAKSLGLCSPSRGASMPRVQRPSEQTLGSMRADIGAASLSVFGNSYDLNPCDSDDHATCPTSPLSAKRRVLSRSALRSHQPVARPISVGLSRGDAAPLARDSLAEPVPDLLGSILSGQSLMLMKGADIVISRDGSLVVKKPGGATSQRNLSREEAPIDCVEPCSSHSGSPTTTSSADTWKPTGQHKQLKFPSSGLYSLSPSPSPPPSSSSPRDLDGITMPSSGMPGTSAFRLRNAFTPRAVQVQSSACRTAPKPGEHPRFNGTVHKPEPSSSRDHVQSKRPDVKHLSRPSVQRLDISELPRIPKIKKETGDRHNVETSRHLESSASTSRNISLPSACVNQLTGRGESHQLGRLSTTENRMKSSREVSQEQPRHSVGVSSSHTSSSSSTALHYSGSSRSVGSLDVGGGGLRITISGNSSNSSRQFSPSVRDPFRTSEGKTQQKSMPPPSTTTTKKEEKPVKNEIYDPFDPTGSDTGSPVSSPERPGSSSLAASATEITTTSQPSGVKVGAFRSFRFLTTHSSKVGISKLGPDFSDQSPHNEVHQKAERVEELSPLEPSYIKVEKEIKKEIVREEKNEQTSFKSSCTLSGLKITSDLKPGGSRGFHFDLEDQCVSVKPEPEPLPSRVLYQTTASNRLVWESPSHSFTSSRDPDLLKEEKAMVIEEPKTCSRSRTRSKDRESRSASWSTEERDKSKSKTHKGKRDRSSSDSCERSKKKRPKKKEKKRKNPASKETKRSRSSSHSSSSHRIYNSKKKKKKKREFRSGSRGQSSSPEKDKRRKHKAEKSYLKDKSSRVKEKKKPKEERGRLRSESPQKTKEHKLHKSKDKSLHFKDQVSFKATLLSPNRGEKAVTCTASVKTQYHPVRQETRTPPLILPKEEVVKDSCPIRDFPTLVKEEKDVALSSDYGDGDDDEDDDVDKMGSNSPPWSPSILDYLFPEDEPEDVQGSPSQEDTPPIEELLPKAEVVSPQDSPLPADIKPPSPMSPSPNSSPSPKTTEPDTLPAIKMEADDLQWSPSHLDDLLLNELSDDMCSVGDASPDDVDLEEALMMKREDDYKMSPNVVSPKREVIPFLQDNGKADDEEAGNHIDETNTNDGISLMLEEAASISYKTETLQASVSKSKPQIKRVTWNLQDNDAEKTAAEKSPRMPFFKLQRSKEELWPGSPEPTGSPLPQDAEDPPSKTSTLLPWNPIDQSIQDSVLLPLNRADTPTQAANPMPLNAVDGPTKEANLLPLIATDKPIQVFPRTLPPLPLPPIFPRYTPVSVPTVPCIKRGSFPLLVREIPSQTPKPGSLATASEPKMKAANTGGGKGKTRSSKKAENIKNDEYMKKLHMQERAVEEVKLAIKPFYQKREITKEEYKDILRKAVQKICHSKSGEINPIKVVNLVKAYVDKYKHVRKHKKSEADDDLDTGRDSPL